MKRKRFTGSKVRRQIRQFYDQEIMAAPVPPPLPEAAAAAHNKVNHGHPRPAARQILLKAAAAVMILGSFRLMYTAQPGTLAGIIAQTVERDRLNERILSGLRQTGQFLHTNYIARRE